MPSDAYDDRLPFHRRNLPAGAGARLKEVRIATGRSREDVAAAAGLAMRTLARIERGHQTPRWPTLKRLCAELGINERSIALRWSQDEGSALTDPSIVPGLGLRALRRQLSIGVQKGPPIGVQKGPPSSSSVTDVTGAPFALVAA